MNQTPKRIRLHHISEQPVNVYAVISLVCGLLAWLALPVVGAVVAVVCGHLALSQLHREPHDSSKSMAIVGLVLGYVQLVFVLLVLGLFVLFGWALWQNIM